MSDDALSLFVAPIGHSSLKKRDSVFSLNIGTAPYPTCPTISAVCWVSRKRVDPDQMPQIVASDLGLHCLLRLVCPNT